MTGKGGGMQEPGNRHVVARGDTPAPDGPGLAAVVKGMRPGVDTITARTEDIQAMVRGYEDRIARQVQSINRLLEQKEAAEARANEATAHIQRMQAELDRLYEPTTGGSTVVSPVLVEYTASGHSPEDRARAEAPVEVVRMPEGEERPGAGF